MYSDYSCILGQHCTKHETSEEVCEYTGAVAVYCERQQFAWCDRARMERQRAIPQQFSEMVKFMESHGGDLGRLQPNPQARINVDILWNELSGLLNNVGGGIRKTPRRWKKVWADWKAKTKKKAFMIRDEACSAAEGLNSRSRLSPLENRVINVMGLAGITQAAQNTIVDGVFEVPTVSSGSQSPRSPGFFPELLDPLEENTDHDNQPPVNHQHEPHNPPSGPSRLRADNSPTASRAPDQDSNVVRRRRRLIQHLLRRRGGGSLPLDSAASNFFANEQRLRLQELTNRRLHERELERVRVDSQRDRRLHEREMERLRIDCQRDRRFHEREMERIRVESERNDVQIRLHESLQRLAEIAQVMIERFPQPSN